MLQFLLVDDDSINNFIGKSYIRDFSPDCIVNAFTSAAEGLVFLSAVLNDPEKHPDVILLDLNMPVMDGWDFLEEYEAKGFVESFPKTQIFILTSSNNPGDLARAMAIPFLSDIFLKPMDEHIVEKIVNHRNQASA